jgi:hypothetical protein
MHEIIIISSAVVANVDIEYLTNDILRIFWFHHNRINGGARENE